MADSVEMGGVSPGPCMQGKALNTAGSGAGPGPNTLTYSSSSTWSNPIPPSVPPISSLDSRANASPILANALSNNDPVTLTCNDNSSQDGISKDDFMALLFLSPNPVILAARKCTHHWRSKYLQMRSRNLWNRICGESYSSLCRDAAQKTCRVSLERSAFIERLASAGPLSVRLTKRFLSNCKGTNCKKQSSRRRGRRRLCSNHALRSNSCLDRTAPLSSQMSSLLHGTNGLRQCGATKLMAPSTPTKRLSVKINRDASLDELALRDSVCTHSLSSSAEAMIASSASSAFLNRNLIGCGGPFVKILRDSSLDKLAHYLADSSSSISHDTNVVIPTDVVLVKEVFVSLNRDSGLDQLARVSGCSNTTMYQPSLADPLNRYSSGEETLNGSEDGLGFCSTPEARDFVNRGFRDIIKLKRIPSGDWRVIQPERLVGSYDPKSSNYYSGAIPESPGVIHPGSLLPSNPDIVQSSIMDSDLSKGGFSCLPKVQCTSRLPSEQIEAGPVVHCSVSKKGTPQTLSVSSAKLTRRTRSTPRTEETPTDENHNENENPRKPLNPAGETPARMKRFGPSQSCKRIVSNLCHESPARSRPTRRICILNINLAKPSIHLYMPIKKPFGQLSPNSHTL